MAGKYRNTRHRFVPIYFNEYFCPIHRTVLKIDKQKDLSMAVRKLSEI